MRRVLHGDVVAAARALLAVESGSRVATMDRMLSEAHAADKFRKRMGRCHRLLGDGTLQGAASKRVQGQEPFLDDRDYCHCMKTVFERLLTRVCR